MQPGNRELQAVDEDRHAKPVLVERAEEVLDRDRALADDAPLVGEERQAQPEPQQQAGRRDGGHERRPVGAVRGGGDRRRLAPSVTASSATGCGAAAPRRRTACGSDRPVHRSVSTATSVMIPEPTIVAAPRSGSAELRWRRRPDQVRRERDREGRPRDREHPRVRGHQQEHERRVGVALVHRGQGHEGDQRDRREAQRQALRRWGAGRRRRRRRAPGVRRPRSRSGGT